MNTIPYAHSLPHVDATTADAPSSRPLPPELQPVKGDVPINMSQQGSAGSVNPAESYGDEVGIRLGAPRPEHFVSGPVPGPPSSTTRPAPPTGRNVHFAQQETTAVQKNIAIIERRMHEIARDAGEGQRRLAFVALACGGVALAVAAYVFLRSRRPAATGSAAAALGNFNDSFQV